MNKEIKIPDGYEAKIENNKIIFVPKESEDERMRKWLIEMVEELKKANPTNAEHNENCSEAVAYLERQKEQKPINECNTHEQTLDEARKWNEVYEKGYSLGYENGRKERQPAEWSEEDEVEIKVLDSIIRYVVEVIDKDVLERFGTNYEELFSWLRTHPSPASLETERGADERS